MNKRVGRPSSVVSSGSGGKRSLTGSSNVVLNNNTTLNTDNCSLINSSSSNVSIYQRGFVAGGTNETTRRDPHPDSAQEPASSSIAGMSSQSESDIRKSSSHLPAKERKNHDRVSLRNFISRALFSSSSGGGGNSRTKSTSSSLTDKQKSKDRKSSSASARSSPNVIQVQHTPTATSSVSVVGMPYAVDGRSLPVVSEGHVDRGSTSGPCETEKLCTICYGSFPVSSFPVLDRNMRCRHAACLDCYRLYLTVQITESRVDLTCPECDAPLHPNDVKMILDDPVMLGKYEQFMIRRVLASDVDTRWCPAPDCGYAVIAAGCAECPRLVCDRQECGTAFCYHCAGTWHPVSTCDEARAQRFGLNISAVATAGAVTFRRTAGNALFSAAPSSLLGKIKPCPRCKALIAKMDDGSCNHMTCTICGADFCWLCMKEISDLHFLSPTGCTFWGKKPWSRKKKLICQLGTLIGAPVGIALVAGVAIPSMIIGIPVWVGRKIHRKMIFSKRYKRNLAVVSGVSGAVLLSPAVAALVVGFGVPLMLAYVYGVVPFSLCRNGGTCRYSSNSNNSVANSTSNLSSEDAVTNNAEEDPSSNIHIRNSSLADTGSLDIINHQLGSKTPDEQLMLRMMMVLDENDVVFVSNNNGNQTDTKSVSETSARIRHRAEINHSNQIDNQNASIGEFSMDSSDVHSQRKLVLLDPSGHSIADVEENAHQERESHVARIRINDEDKPNFDSASTLALNLSTRRQSASSDSVNCSLGDRITLETLSADLDYLVTAYSNKDSLEVAEQDNASTKALAGSILGNRDRSHRVDFEKVLSGSVSVQQVDEIAQDSLSSGDASVKNSTD